MMTQSVMTQAASLFGNAAGSVNSKGKQHGSGFELILGNNLKSATDSIHAAGSSGTKKASIQKIDNNNNTDDKKDRSQVADAADKVIDDNKETLKSSDLKTAKQKDIQPTDNTTDETTAAATQKAPENELIPSEQIMAQISGMLQAIRETVMKMLNLTSEKLDQLLEDQGLNTMDLLQPENLQKLVLANSGETDITAVLTDENLADTMKQLLQAVEGIKEEADLPFTEEQINTFMDQSKQWKDFIHLKKEDHSSVVTEKEQATEADKTEAATLTEEIKQPDLKNGREDTPSMAKEVLTRENSNSFQSNTGSEEKKDLQAAADQFQLFLDHMTASIRETVTDFTGTMNQISELREIANQIIDKIKVSVQPGNTSIELQLNPEHLGKVNLTVQSKNGVMTASFVVQNEISKEAIESQMHTLRETLNQQGIKVEAIEVAVSAYAFDQHNQDGANAQTDDQKNPSGKKISLEDALNMTELPEEESNTSDLTGIRASQIDYIA